MKRLLLAALLMCAGPVFAAGVHVDDIEYQDWLNKLTPEFTAIIRAIELAKNAADEVDAVDPGTTVAAFCALLYPTQGSTTCDTSGEEHYDITDSLMKLANRSQQMYDCATNQTCAAAPRLTGLRRNSNETNKVTVEETKYQLMFDSMVSNARNLLNALLESDITNELANQVEASKTDAQLCAQWFPTATCVADTPLDRTQDLKAAAGAMDSLFDCANNIACGTDTRLTKMRQIVELP